MVGSQALLAFRDSKGRMSAYTTLITGYNPSMQPRKLQFRVSKLSAEYANNEITIFAVVGPLVNGPVVNQVWQVGSLDRNGVPQMHAMELENLQSTGIIDFSSSL
ncbi:cytochrome b561 and DOMON domain-containing protein At5g48750-like [Cynara cardunculus var. scolymus]|uniref:cytochrome b561 and DOMON domain-containing protein At5g48750-like n=1 Tax=Cynara cardunculus var. scolymus TaxID=59895 RepID=UPI000D6301AD|nr:cytochrome b561 and DOMON domain-containing protein At5g48750-like [Cynara cardunculus var. scolymus]